ncbi:carboxypeptidase-like regulatory domain-containing protein [Capnocytophaga sp. Marseille-Q4570]|uniref:Carboxypeptidase-like regulatory domain-containing protein n=1 Tax=Capnocytophaga bilenii TaxID=2819369 RepID=A0ABS3PV80_9FLAO|nr:carboxypeptidase-like regulatory domain-containing protein [Capnocytophaga bilenii]MBO1883037.1 carboxypeptidase-like regulatory domain-containing protein [Capnocytophaga bilenii]
MKKVLLIQFFLLQSLLQAQTIEFTVLDATTKLPISNVEIYYTNSINGTITNEEGKAKIALENDTLTLSHIGYTTKKNFTDKTFAKATIYLNPQEIQLEEVVLYNFDLKKRVKYVLDNYFKLYDTKAKIVECTYREKMIRNDTLRRLYQIQLDWWSKNYVYQFKEPLNKNVQIHLKNTDYSKISNFEDGTNSAFFEPTFIFQYLHLNPYLVFLYNAKNIQIKKVEKDKEHTIVTFDFDIISNKEIIQFANSVIYFDNTTNAIKRIAFTQKPINGGGVSEKKKIPYKTINNKGTWELTFTSYNNKLLFSSFTVKMSCMFQYENKQDYVNIEQSFLRTGIQNKHIKKENRIDVEKPFFEYVTPHKQGEAKFLLTKEEQEFINQ